MSAKDQSVKPRLRTWASIASGSMAASTAVLISNMPETIKIRMQLDGEASKRAGSSTPRQYTSTLDAYRKIVRHEGFRALQAGLGPAIGIQIIMNGLRLGLFEPLQRLNRDLTKCSEHNTLNKVVSGATSGVIGVALSSPL